MPSGVYDIIWEDLDDSPVTWHITEVPCVNVWGLLCASHVAHHEQPSDSRVSGMLAASRPHRERECCLLVLNLVSSTLSCIRQYQNEWLGDVVSAPSGPLCRTFLRRVHSVNTLLPQGLWYCLTAQMAAESLCWQINIY